MEKQFDLYTAIVLITILLVAITIADVLTNRLVSRKLKTRALAVCLLIAGASIGECLGVLTNGTSAAWIIPHKIAKFVEFSCAPAIGIAAAMAYGAAKRPGIAVGVVAAHAVFECVALGFDWVFYIDAQNIYHRESLYCVYVITFALSILYCLICIIRSGREYQTGIDSVLVLTMVMTVLGISIQFVASNIRVDFLCVAIGNMLLYSRYYKMVLQVDPVTRLLNRRCYDANISNLDSSVVVIFFDINKFKQVNDTYGHSVGDLCLRNVAERISAAYVKHGTCYRIGGDEFCVILSSDLDQLKALNQRFLDSIHQLQLDDSRMPSVALGYAYYDAGTSHIQTVIEEADAMMYKNKQR